MFIWGIEPLMSVEGCAILPLRKLGSPPGGRGGFLRRNQFRKIRVNCAKVIVDPRESRVVDTVGGDQQVFGVIALGLNEL